MVAAAVPMVGFGIMDNTIMIFAGDYIDATFGVMLGLSTLTAAAMGQVLSDFCGVCFGGTVEALAARCGLPDPKLTSAQRRLPIVGTVTTAGAAIGVLTGCCIGMTSLLFKDLDKADRERRARRLEYVFTTVLRNGHEVLGAERATLWLYDKEKNELWTRTTSAVDTCARARARPDRARVPMPRTH